MEQRLPGEGKDLLGRLMREGTLSPEVLDRLLGAYTIFEYRDGKCFRRHASETYLKMLYLDDAIPVGYHRCANTPDYDFTFVSNRFAQMLGFTRQEIREEFNDKFKNMVHPDDWARLFDGESRA